MARIHLAETCLLLTSDADIEDLNGTIPISGNDDALWVRLRTEIAEGDTVTGKVICRRLFGVFLDIGYGSKAAALLLVPEFTDAHVNSYDFDDYPLVGDLVTARILRIGWESHKIALTQNQTYVADSRSWTQPKRDVP